MIYYFLFFTREREKEREQEREREKIERESGIKGEGRQTRLLTVLRLAAGNLHTGSSLKYYAPMNTCINIPMKY